MSDKKFCKSCGQFKDISSFRKRRKKCIDCINLVRTDYYHRMKKIEDLILKDNLTEEDILLLNSEEYNKNWREEKHELSLKERRDRWAKNKDNRLEKNKKIYYNKDKFAEILFNYARRRAKKLKLDFDLDIQFINDLYQTQNGRCALTNIKFEFERTEKYSRRPFTASIDRIINDLGYTKNNIRLVCVIVNMSINEFGEDVFDQMCRAYVDKHTK